MSVKKPKLDGVIPENLATCVDKYYQVREYRLAQQKLVDEIEEYEKALRENLIENIPKSDMTGVAGKLARATIDIKEIPRVENWDDLYKHISRTKSWELLGRKVGEAAVKERWASGKTVPGVRKFKTRVVRINKV